MSETQLDDEDKRELKKCGAGTLFKINVDDSHLHMLEHVREIVLKTDRMLEKPWVWLMAHYYVWSYKLDEEILLYVERIESKKYNELVNKGKL